MDSFFFFQAEDGIRYLTVTGVQTCALPIFRAQNPAGTHSAATHARLSSALSHGGSDSGYMRSAHALPTVKPSAATPDELTVTEIGRARVGKECRSRWSPYH